VQFNILNFTKKQSLYNCGMRVCVRSELECKNLESDPFGHGWRKDCINIRYKLSKLSETLAGLENEKKYYEL